MDTSINNIKCFKTDISNKNITKYITKKYASDIHEVINKSKSIYNQYLPLITIGYEAYKRIGYKKILYENELKEIAEILNISFLECLVMNLVYEFCSACTTLITENEDSKELLMLRTMDWELPELKKITIRIKYTKNGKPFADVVTWAGSVGIFTGVNLVSNVAIALNYRRSKVPSISENIKATFSGSWPCSYIIRSILLDEDRPITKEKRSGDEHEFAHQEQILYLLGNSPTISPCYFTVAFPNEGYIITKDRTTRTIKSLGSDHGLVQTNIDYNEDEKIMNSQPDIMDSKKRYSLGVDYLENKTKNIDSLINLSKKYPINNDATIYTVIMSSTKGIIYSCL